MSNNINFNNKETNNNNKNKLIKKFIIASIIIGILGTGLSGYSIIAALTRTFEGEYGLLVNAAYLFVGIIGLFITYATILILWGIYGLINYYKTVEDNNKKTLIVVTASIIGLIVIRILIKVFFILI